MSFMYCLSIATDLKLEMSQRLLNPESVQKTIQKKSNTSTTNTKSKGLLSTRKPKATNKYKKKAEQYLPEAASLKNEDYIVANAQILLSQTSKTYYDIYNNWEDIIQINFYTHEDIICPICLAPPIVPRTDICGHVYCLPCLNKFLSFKSEFHNNCAICNQWIDIRRIKRAGIIHQFPLKLGDTLAMLLMKRDKLSNFPTPVDLNLFSIPHVNTVESRFSNVTICSNDYLLSIIQMELFTLEDELISANEEGDRIIAITDAFNYVKNEFEELSSIPLLDVTNKAFPNYITVESLKHTIANESVYYQSEEGCHVFLCHLNWRCMSHEFLDKGICLPSRISAPVIDIERFVVSPEFHNRYRYLRHLPIGSSVSFVELDLSDIVSQSTLEKFQDAIKNKSYCRFQKEKIDEIETMNKINQENSFHDGSKFIHVPSLMAAAALDQEPLKGIEHCENNNIKSFSHMLKNSLRESLHDQIANMTINEVNNFEQSSSRGILLSDCVVVKSKKKNRRR